MEQKKKETDRPVKKNIGSKKKKREFIMYMGI